MEYIHNVQKGPDMKFQKPKKDKSCKNYWISERNCTPYEVLWCISDGAYIAKHSSGYGYQNGWISDFYVSRKCELRRTVSSSMVFDTNKMELRIMYAECPPAWSSVFGWGQNLPNYGRRENAQESGRHKGISGQKQTVSKYLIRYKSIILQSRGKVRNSTEPQSGCTSDHIRNAIVQTAYCPAA